jgi:hypothetical protein
MNKGQQETLDDSAMVRKQVRESRLRLKEAVEESAAARYASASSRTKRLLIKLDNPPIVGESIKSQDFQ